MNRYEGEIFIIIKHIEEYEIKISSQFIDEKLKTFQEKLNYKVKNLKNKLKLLKASLLT